MVSPNPQNRHCKSTTLFQTTKTFSIIFLHRFPHRKLLPPLYEGKDTSAQLLLL
nr:MAG TPA: hypothetical protein [Caudoviricetes sp.]